MASIFRQKYTVKDDSGKIIRKQSQYWYIDYRTADGTRKRVKGFKDKTATVQLAARLEKEAELAEAGIVDKYAEHRKRPLSQHLEDFYQALLAKGGTIKHAQQTKRRVECVIKSCKFAFWSDVSASKVQRYLAERRSSGLSVRSSNFYLQAVKQFCHWLVADGRAAENPLAYLRGQNPKTDIRHARRALSIEELDRLIRSTSNGQEHSGMPGRKRAMLYSLAVSTGLRAGELASLTWQSFNLSDSTPFVTVLAAYSKHRRDDILPLRIDIAQQIAEWNAEDRAEEQAKVFGEFRAKKAAKMLRKDLEAAGIPYKDESGRVADFHSLRHTFISNLTRGGASPKIAQSLARHSTIGLTMDTYTHVGLYDERTALDSLPELPPLDSKKDNGNKAVALKTGTDDVSVEVGKSAYKPAYKKLTKNAYFDKNQLSPNVHSSNENGEVVESDKSLSTGMLGTENNQISPLVTEKKQRRRWESNPRITVLQTVALGHLATPPIRKSRLC